MNRFKKILLPLHGENKERLGRIYQDKQVYISSVRSSAQPIEEARIFYFDMLSFWFSGTGIRNKERMELFVSVPSSYIFLTEAEQDRDSYLPYEDFLLRAVSPEIETFTSEMENRNKDTREKARFTTQKTNEFIRRRSGLVFDKEREAFILKILFYMPLINNSGINAKSGFKAVRGVLERIREIVIHLDEKALQNQLTVYRHQSEIREWLETNHKMAFVANGSILPRQGETSEPLCEAVPFISPKNLEETILFSDGTDVTGMAVPEGVTVITGGGYSGKSTLLDALEAGVWRHIPGDGREYVLALPDSVKIYAEDGRVVHEMDVSFFFENMPGGVSMQNFSTVHASGSVSQAANIIEAVYAGSRVLLIDEDTSATNFMIRDAQMRRLIHKEPIIPYTDRVRFLYEKEGVSSILVIGGSSEYLCHADRILMMEDYRLLDVTDTAKEMVSGKKFNPGSTETSWDKYRYLERKKQNIPFTLCRLVNVENSKRIQIDNFAADVTRLTALTSENQLQTLAYFLKKILTEVDADQWECREMAEQICMQIFKPEIIHQIWGNAWQFPPLFEEIRPVDLLGALFRMRGIHLRQDEK